MTPSGAPLHGGALDTALPPGPETLELLRSGLRLMALRALGDLDTAEEVAQETIARALAALRGDRAGDIQDLGAFVHGIARHVIGDAQRARQRAAGTEPLETTPVPDPGPDPLSHAVSADDRARVREALAGLNAADRQLLHLSFYDGLTPAELAARLGEPAARVRKRKSRALERLRRVFLGGAPRHDGPPSATEKGILRLASPGEPGGGT